MQNYLTFTVTDPDAVKAIFRSCAHFDAASLSGTRKPFDRMLRAMHRDENANDFARAFVEKCSNVELSDRGGTSNCIFLTPAGKFVVLGDSCTKGWIVILGAWESQAIVRGYLEPLAKLYDPTQLIINFPQAEEHALTPIPLQTVLERLAGAA